jgi:hypothetical protein
MEYSVFSDCWIHLILAACSEIDREKSMQIGSSACSYELGSSQITAASIKERWKKVMLEKKHSNYFELLPVKGRVSGSFSWWV